MANERRMTGGDAWTPQDRGSAPRRRKFRGKVQEICQEEQFLRQRRSLQGSRLKRERNYQTETYLPDYNETMVHYNKSFGVLQELFDHRDFLGLAEELHSCAVAAAALCGEPVCPRFLDLGCAPGGFSACLLQDHILGPMSVGWGVSLPPQLGGFQMVMTTPRLCVQFEDLLQVMPHELLCTDNSIDICVADAQYLSNMFKPQHQAAKYRGTKVRSRTLGIWALTIRECQLAFSKLRQSGSFIFRFGWRGVGSADVHPSGEKVHPDLLAKYLQEEEWYTALTHWLFSILKSLFNTLRPFKSEYVHQADVSFYMVCRSFDREKFEMHNWEAKLQRAYDEITNCQDEALLVAGLKNSINQGTKAEIDGLLDYVGRMRAIGIQSRKVTNPKAFTPWAKTGDEKSQKEPNEDPPPEGAEKPAAEQAKQEVAKPKSDASTELEERSESSSAATLASEPSGVAEPSGPTKAAEGPSVSPTPSPPPPPPPPAKAKVQEFREKAPRRPVDKGEISSNWRHRQERSHGPWVPPGDDAWSMPWVEAYHQPEVFYPNTYSNVPNVHVGVMDMDGVCLDGMGGCGHGHMMEADGMANVHMLHADESMMYQVVADESLMLQADGMANAMMHADESMMLQADGMSAAHLMHPDESMMLQACPMMEGDMVQDWTHSMPHGAYRLQAMPPPPPAAPPPLLPQTGLAEANAAGPSVAGLAHPLPFLATTVDKTGRAVSSTALAEEEAPLARQRSSHDTIISEEQEALEAMNLSDEEGDDDPNQKRRRHKKRRDKDKLGGRRGKSDVLRAIRILQRQGRVPVRPWYLRLQDSMRSAILDMHQDSVQALRFGICFAMCWSLCSLVMSLIRFSSQYGKGLQGGDEGALGSMNGTQM